MLHASGRARFAMKTLLRGLVAQESLAQNFYGDGSIDEQMRRAIDRAHTTAAEPLIQTVLTIEHVANHPIDRLFSDCHVRLQRREIRRAHVHVVRVSLAALWALEHKNFRRARSLSLTDGAER